MKNPYLSQFFADSFPKSRRIVTVTMHSVNKVSILTLSWEINKTEFLESFCQLFDLMYPFPCRKQFNN